MLTSLCASRRSVAVVAAALAGILSVGLTVPETQAQRVVTQTKNKIIFGQQSSSPQFNWSNNMWKATSARTTQKMTVPAVNARSGAFFANVFNEEGGLVYPSITLGWNGRIWDQDWRRAFEYLTPINEIQSIKTKVNWRTRFNPTKVWKQPANGPGFYKRLSDGSFETKESWNIAYDLWFHSPEDATFMENRSIRLNRPTYKKFSHELMVWLTKEGFSTPIGANTPPSNPKWIRNPDGYTNINGIRWGFWTGQGGGGHPVISYFPVPASVGNVSNYLNQTSQIGKIVNKELDLKLFINHASGINFMPSDQVFSGVQFGSEINFADGRFDVFRYTCDIRTTN